MRKALISITIIGMLSVMLTGVACGKVGEGKYMTFTLENVKHKGMSLESLKIIDGTSILTTTGGVFYLNFKDGTIEIRQRVGADRLLAKIEMFEERLSISAIPSPDGFDCTWAGNYPEDPKIIISGDSVVRFINFKKLEVALYFAPVHQKFNVSITPFDNGGLLALDDMGGLAIIPPSYCSNESWPKTFEDNTWKLAAEKPLPLLFVGVLPPRLFDWDRSFWPVIHYSSHVQRYPTDEQIAAYSKYAKILEMHSWVWQSHCETDNSEKKPLWADCSYWPQNGRWIPYAEDEFRRVIKTAHVYGMKVLPYVSSENDGGIADFGTYMAEIKRLKETYDIDGVYLDGLYYQRPELGYPSARALRELFGEDGWITVHDTHGSGYWVPFINTYEAVAQACW